MSVCSLSKFFEFVAYEVCQKQENGCHNFVTAISFGDESKRLAVSFVLCAYLYAAKIQRFQWFAAFWCGTMLSHGTFETTKYQNSTRIEKVPRKRKSSALSLRPPIFEAFEGFEPVLPAVFPVRSALENELEPQYRPALTAVDPFPNTGYRPDRRCGAYHPR